MASKSFDEFWKKVKANSMATKKAAVPAAKKAPVAAPPVEEEVVETEDMSIDEADIQAELDALDDSSWDNTEKKEGGDLPDDRYQVRIEKADINKSKSSGRLQVSFDFMVVGDSEHRNRHCYTHFGIADDEQRGYLRGALAKLGVDWPTRAEFNNTIASLVGTYCQVNLKTRKKRNADGNMEERQNVYIDKALDPQDIPEVLDEIPGEEVVEEAPAPAAPKPAVKKPAAAPKKPAPAPEPEPEVMEEVAEEAADETPAEEVVEDAGEEVVDDVAPEEVIDETPAEETPEGVTLAADAKITTSEVGKIATMATKLEFNPADYTKKKDLLVDVAEHLGVSGGEYESVAVLIAACEAMMPKPAPVAKAPAKPAPKPAVKK